MNSDKGLPNDNDLQSIPKEQRHQRVQYDPSNN